MNKPVTEFVKMKTRYLIWIMLLLSGCESPFSMREPEEPANPQSGWVPAYSSVELVLNFQNAVLEKNAENYTRCLFDPAYGEKIFSFVPDQQVAAEHGVIFEGWSRDHELAVVNQLFSLVSTDSLSVLRFPEGYGETSHPDSVIISGAYELEVRHERTTLDSIRFKGYLEFWMAPDQRGEWAIYHWIDYGMSGYFSWSALKAALGG